jgi:hypothetical protein
MGVYCIPTRETVNSTRGRGPGRGWAGRGWAGRGREHSVGDRGKGNGGTPGAGCLGEGAPCPLLRDAVVVGGGSRAEVGRKPGTEADETFKFVTKVDADWETANISEFYFRHRHLVGIISLGFLVRGIVYDMPSLHSIQFPISNFRQVFLQYTCLDCQ